MTKEHRWHVVMPTFSTSEGKIYLDDEEFEFPVTRMNISIIAGEPVRITTTIIPGGLDALLAFSEENPLAIEIHWPQCPHCGKLYDDPGNEPRWSIYSLVFRLLGNTRLWPAASRITWG